MHNIKIEYKVNSNSQAKNKDRILEKENEDKLKLDRQKNDYKVKNLNNKMEEKHGLIIEKLFSFRESYLINLRNNAVIKNNIERVEVERQKE